MRSHILSVNINLTQNSLSQKAPGLGLKGKAEAVCFAPYLGRPGYPVEKKTLNLSILQRTIASKSNRHFPKQLKEQKQLKLMSMFDKKYG